MSGRLVLRTFGCALYGVDDVSYAADLAADVMFDHIRAAIGGSTSSASSTFARVSGPYDKSAHEILHEPSQAEDSEEPRSQ